MKTSELYQRRLSAPPHVDDPSLQLWMRDVADQLNGLIPVSTFSYPTPESYVTAIEGTVGANIALGQPSLWIKESGSGDTGWASVATATAAVPIAYGGFYNETITSTITTPGTSGKTIPWMNEMPSRNVSQTTATACVILPYAGVYDVHGYITGTTSRANIEFSIYIYKNASSTSLGGHNNFASASNKQMMSVGGLVSCVTNDALALWVRQEGGTASNITISDAQFTVHLVS